MFIVDIEVIKNPAKNKRTPTASNPAIFVPPAIAPTNAIIPPMMLTVPITILFFIY